MLELTTRNNLTGVLHIFTQISFQIEKKKYMNFVIPYNMCLSYLSYCFLFIAQDLQGLRWEPNIVPHVSGAHNNTPETLYLIASSVWNARMFTRTL